MHESQLVFYFFLIFSGAAVLASIALFTRQPLLIAYIALGAAIGPYGWGFIENSDLLSEISEIGIIFLLFLIGLDMQPANLWHTLKKATTVAMFTCFLFACIGFGVALLFNYSQAEAIIIGLAMMFSSTIVAIKLLPTTVLHHKHTGELMVGVLLLQDLVAIVVLMVLGDLTKGDRQWYDYGLTFLSLPLLILGAWLFVKFAFLPLLQAFDKFQEYVFLLAIGWCLGMAEVAKVIGLSHEVGAFIAGVSIASSPISFYIASSLKPIRDFFLILFFFSIGASFNFMLLNDVLVASLVLAISFLVIKPVVFRLMLEKLSETKSLAWDVGFRLGQNSEFSILIAYIAVGSAVISEKASMLIQATAILTFAVSSYIIVFNFPNPIAVSEKLRRD